MIDTIDIELVKWKFLVWGVLVVLAGIWVPFVILDVLRPEFFMWLVLLVSCVITGALIAGVGVLLVYYAIKDAEVLDEQEQGK